MCFNSTVMCSIPPQYIPNPLIATRCYISDKSAIYWDWLWKYLFEIYCLYIGEGCARSEDKFFKVSSTNTNLMHLYTFSIFPSSAYIWNKFDLKSSKYHATRKVWSLKIKCLLQLRGKVNELKLTDAFHKEWPRLSKTI